jgi:uncharacterized membrane protein YfcA
MSGVAHIRSGNVDWQALVRVAIPGAIGAFLGAFFLSSIGLSKAKPVTASILLYSRGPYSVSVHKNVNPWKKARGTNKMA